MPDPTRKTISASEAAALWNASPYLTRWMLWQRFANGVDISGADDARKSWGRKMQPLIIQQVAADKKLEVIPNVSDTYVRRGLFGCTRDAVIICPDRGPGALEIKCVFDYRIWATEWRGGDHVPRHNDIQLQTQMYVGEGNISLDGIDFTIGDYKWGMIAAWVCGDIYYFERKPIAKLQDDMQRSAVEFFASVSLGREPDAFGAACEADLIRELFPLEPGKELDFSDDPDHVKTSESVSMYQTHKDIADANKGPMESLRLKLLAVARDAEFVKLPCGVSFRIKKSGKGKTIVPYVPDRPLPPPPPKTQPILAGG